MTLQAEPDARETYAFDGWSGGYFDVDALGHVSVFPNPSRARVSVDLCELAGEVEKQGLRLPILVRFNDILKHRVAELHRVFADAMSRHEYRGDYTPVYPIKVNQQHSVVTHLVDGDQRVGLESGSKPELMAILGTSCPGGIIVCNGYKDSAYLRLAMIGQQMGYRVYIVIEKLAELDLLVREAREMGVKPLIGLRVRLATIGGGQWQNTGGTKSKFGLSAQQVIEVLNRLEQNGLKEQLVMLHVHLGSQIPTIAGIRRGIREAMRFYTEISQRGFAVAVFDVGGGLGIDYEGTRSSSSFSTNYNLDEYANCIVETVCGVCREHELPEPRLFSESGRALTAHHAVLITDVIGRESVETDLAANLPGEDSTVFQFLVRLSERLNETDDPTDASSIYSAASSGLASMHDDFAWGQIDIAQRAHGEKLYRSILLRVSELARKDRQHNAALIEELRPLLAEQYFCNLSIFQSMPDIWALGQIFPIVPLQRLDTPPTHQVVLRDLTCDSDGRIDFYVGAGGRHSTLSAHPIEPGERYLLGFFLVGAYQEILGDMHNLFGDTASVNVDLNQDGSFKLSSPEPGDRADKLLRYVNFDPEELMRRYRERIAEAPLSETLRSEYLASLQSGLRAYTYMEG